MKQWLGYMLSVYIVFSTVVPCSIFDKCEERDQTEQGANKQPKNDCNGCSPFSICQSAHGFALTTIATTIEPFVLDNSASYCEYYFSSKTEYYPSLFQPPRVA